MVISPYKIDRLKELLSERRRITVVSHINPDGDAIGSGLAWTHILRSMGHEVEFIVPNSYPCFLNWMPDMKSVRIFKSEAERCADFIAGSDIFFFLDLNMPDRLEGLGKAIGTNTKAVRVLIDHHLNPPDIFDISISHTEASSTSFLVYKLAEAMGAAESITLAEAELLYVGISTDTGNFSFGNLTPELYAAVARLVEKGVDTVKLNNAIYNNFSVDRTRLMGYLLGKKMKVMKDHEYAAYICVSREELLKYRFRQGDSEGFVNIPLSIKGMKLSAFFMETKEGVKVSLRSKGDIDVDMMARKYFNGGGHKNAAGGKIQATIKETVDIFRKAVKSDFKDISNMVNSK